MMPEDDGGYWVSVSEAARRLGCSRQAIQKRITRGTIPTRVNNRGERLVQAVAGAAPVSSAPVTVTTRQPAAPVRTSPEVDRSGLISLADVRHLLGEQAERLERAHRDALALVQEHADASAVRAERAERLLFRMMAERARRPWWLRWLGSVVVFLVAF